MFGISSRKVDITVLNDYTFFYKKPSSMPSIVIIIIKNLFTVGYNTIVYPMSGKLIHTNYLQKYNCKYSAKGFLIFGHTLDLNCL